LIFLPSRYWIGTFENRPGAGLNHDHNARSFPGNYRAEAYKDPMSGVPAGSKQGDGPQGTLTSQPFIIKGTKITLMVGGGCNQLLEYVELVVDGLSTPYRATGKCLETMERVEWHLDLDIWGGLSGQIRVVDASSSNWGHINVDDIRFNWDVVQEDTPKAGAVYTFRRKIGDTSSDELCLGIHQRTECTWEQQAKLQASDKQANDLFGWSLAVDDGTGMLVVGSPHSDGLDHYKQIVDGAENVGSVYVYQRVAENRDGLGVLIASPTWPSYELAKIQPNELAPNVNYGWAVGLSNYQTFVSAVGDDALGTNAGAAYHYDIRFQQVQFTDSEFVAIEENTNNQVIVRISRSGSTDLPLTIGYSTSDITAIGVDDLKYALCQELAPQQRAGCGDYLLTSSEITFGAGQSSKEILIFIVNDRCYEHFPEHFQVNLHIPGGPPLLGPNFVATVRLDDEDWLDSVCDQATTLSV
jgi:hypothetical protein